MCIAVEGRHGVDVRDSLILKLFGSTLCFGQHGGGDVGRWRPFVEVQGTTIE